MKQETINNAIMYLEQLETFYNKTKQERKASPQAKKSLNMLIVGLKATIKELKQEE